MASLKEVRSRIQSVNSTQQITKAMKMVAAAKLRRAQERINQLRPFEKRLSTISARLTDALGQDYESALSRPNGSKDVLIISITSDRGLCGAFNSNVIKATSQLIQERYAGAAVSGDIHIMCLGKKGCEFFTRRKMNVIEGYQDVFQTLSYARVAEAAEHAIGCFMQGEVGEVVVVYNESKNVATQVIRVEQLLPLQPPAVVEGAAPTANVDYILEPSAEAIMESLVPRMLKTKVYKAVLESNAAEQGARMTAMDKATENAGEMLKQLKLTYNRTRQAAITTEILEIVGGAEALASS